MNVCRPSPVRLLLFATIFFTSSDSLHNTQTVWCMLFLAVDFIDFLFEPLFYVSYASRHRRRLAGHKTNVQKKVEGARRKQKTTTTTKTTADDQIKNLITWKMWKCQKNTQNREKKQPQRAKELCCACVLQIGRQKEDPWTKKLIYWFHALSLADGKIMIKLSSEVDIFPILVSLARCFMEEYNFHMKILWRHAICAFSMLLKFSRFEKEIYWRESVHQMPSRSQSWKLFEYFIRFLFPCVRMLYVR